MVDGVGQRLPVVFDTPVGDFNTANWASPRMLERPEVCRAVALMQKQAAEYLSPGGGNDRTAWRDLLVTQFGFAEPVYESVLENLGAEWRFDDVRRGQFEGAGRRRRRSSATGTGPFSPRRCGSDPGCAPATSRCATRRATSGTAAGTTT